MKKITFLFLLCSMLLSIHLKAGNNIMFEKANQLYQNKNFDSAASLYTQMIEDGYCHPDLYYNAGNAYYRSNKIGMAVWYYKKAVSIHEEKNYTDNLQLAQKRIKNYLKPTEEIFFIKWWNNMYQMFTVNKWAIICITFFLFTMIFLYLKNFLNIHKVPSFVRNMCATLFFISLFFMLIRFYNDTYHFKGIVITDTQCKMGAKLKDVNISEGNEVEYISRKNNMLSVKLPNGNVCLIPEKSFKKL